MCGIAGVLVSADGTPPDPRELRRMARALRHRGPDGFGLYLDDAVGLAHTRLSIIDRAGGAQPLCNEDGTIWVAFNGEIFNYLELREELEARGHRFRTRSDTEVIVHAYEEWREDCWSRFNGQFAIALRDSTERQLWLARDRVGITPLFVSESSAEVVFASEMKAIFASGRVRARPDPRGVAAVFTLWAAPAPGTVFTGVHCVRPGTAVRFDERLRATALPFHALRLGASGGCSHLSPEDAAEQLGHLMRRAVRIRLRADVPVGAYLSGGLDSSLVARMVRLENSSPLETFSVRFPEERFDEGPAQHRMSRILGTRHHEIVVTPRLVQEELPLVVRHCETPLLRTAPVPMFLLSALVRREGMRVVLTGEGADEFLGGYDIFAEDKVRRFWARSPTSACRPLLLGSIHPYVANAKGAMWQEFFRRGLADVGHPFYSHRLRWENTGWARRFLAPDVRSALDDAEPGELLAGALPAGWDAADPLSRAQHLEIAGFMTPYLLASQGDRALMAHGVEGRYPYLDPDVIDFCAALPSRLKLRGLRQKVVLRELAAGLLPEDVAERRKWPFRAPIAEALFGPGAPDYVRDLLSPDGLASCPFIDASSAERFCGRAWSPRAQFGEREEMALMGLLTLQLWYRQFCASSGAPALESSDDDARDPPLVHADRRTRR